MSKLDFHGGRKEKRKEEESAVLEATLAQLKLSWVWAGVGLRLTNIHYEYNTTNKQQTGETKNTTNTRGINDTTTKAQQHTKQTGTKPRI